MKVYFKSKKVTVLSITLIQFLIAVIWYQIHINFLNEYVDQISSNLGLVILALPFFIIPLFFIRENNSLDSIKFGIIVGFFSGILFLIFMTIPDTLNSITGSGYKPDIGFLLSVWIVFSLVFTISSTLGAILSFQYRKPIIE